MGQHRLGGDVVIRRKGHDVALAVNVRQISIDIWQDLFKL